MYDMYSSVVLSGCVNNAHILQIFNPFTIHNREVYCMSGGERVKYGVATVADLWFRRFQIGKS